VIIGRRKVEALRNAEGWTAENERMREAEFSAVLWFLAFLAGVKNVAKNREVGFL